MFAHHDGIDDKRKTEFSGASRDRPDDLFISKRAGLRGLGQNVGKYGFKLMDHVRGLDRINGSHAARVLDGQERHDRHAIDLVPVESFQIGLDAGTA